MDLRTWGTVWAFLCFVAGGSAQTEEEDEKRPYKFAFNIEGYQHRSEEKDERGIINGEYGFVTGDGVYHVTVYATDENGDFKILSMKNYYIGLPGQETTTTRATEPPRPRVTPPPPPPPSPSYSTTISPIIQHLNGLMGCSGCIIPEKNTTKTPGASFPEPEIKDDIDIRVEVESPEFSSGVSKGPLSSVKPSSIDTSYMGVQYVHFNDAEVSSTTPCSDCGITAALRPSSGSPGLDIDWKFGEPPSVTSGGPISDFPSGKERGSPEPPSFKPPEDNGIPEVFKEIYSARPNSQGDEEGSRGTLKQSGNPNVGSPTEEADSDRFAKDLMERFYQFHYILRYNGHNETGYRNGVKEGDYFVNGRDGLGRNVKYVANEFGYQPNITLINLGLESPDIPKEQGEEPNELKSSEFTWFYGS